MWPPPKGLYLDEYFNLHYPSGIVHGIHKYTLAGITKKLSLRYSKLLGLSRFVQLNLRFE